MAKEVFPCGGIGHHLGGCECGTGSGSSGKSSKKSRKGTRTDVIGNLSKDSADKWVKQMGSMTEEGKERHYETVPDTDNPGKYKLVFVEDE